MFKGVALCAHSVNTAFEKNNLRHDNDRKSDMNEDA